MRRPRVYIDTSVIGGCFDDEFRPWSLALFADFGRSRFVPVVSDLIAAEIAEAPGYVLRKYEELLSGEHERLELSEEVFQLAGQYLRKGILSANFENDALHIALASVGQVDLLVSWNFRHIVRYDKIRQFSATNLENGYRSVQIYSPREVAHDEDNTDQGR